ncbi:hypothetical protein Mgra_00005883 [Meloidogyne graminicola]|uniref:MFS domain-containing protein n=1 Tax=Meloidogyne graminicola TaxID=189291 RepID=A0A8S9ZN59_9BILA|nr:hypothetical protein Mgra_00005883 [Meloidogyne graminicola]
MQNSIKDSVNEKQCEAGTLDKQMSFKSTTTMMPETNWNSIYVASILSFVGTVQFSLYFSSMWPYVQIIDRSINETMFGYIIAVYSVGQIISAPLFGFWSNKIQQVRIPLFVGLTLMFLGNLCYLSLELSTIPKLYILLFGRFMTGMGSGNVCLLRTYASTASTSKDRSRAIAFVTCGQALGTTSGPAFQLLFTSFSYPGTTFFGQLRFNLYTGPAFLSCTMNLFGAIILLLFFKEIYAGLFHGEKNKIVAVENGESIKSSENATNQAFKKKKLFFYNRLNFRLSCILSLVGLAAFHLFTFSWPFLNEPLPLYTEKELLEYKDSQLPSEKEPVGCNVDKFNYIYVLQFNFYNL